MKKPKHFPRLSEPSYILSTPIIFQYVAIFLIAGIPSAYFVWFYLSYQRQSLRAIDYVVLVVMAVLFLLVFRRNTWREWISFAADKKGIYIACQGYDRYVFIPWENVGKSAIGMGERRVKSVLISVTVSHAQWRELTGSDPKSVRIGNDQRQVTQNINVGNSCRNVEKIRENLERIRSSR